MTFCDVLNHILLARQFNLIRDALSAFKPEEMVFDYEDLSRQAPWENNISLAVTSCGNFFRAMVRICLVN